MLDERKLKKTRNGWVRAALFKLLPTKSRSQLFDFGHLHSFNFKWFKKHFFVSTKWLAMESVAIRRPNIASTRTAGPGGHLKWKEAKFREANWLPTTIRD